MTKRFLLSPLDGQSWRIWLVLGTGLGPRFSHADQLLSDRADSNLLAWYKKTADNEKHRFHNVYYGTATYQEDDLNPYGGRDGWLR